LQKIEKYVIISYTYLIHNPTIMSDNEKNVSENDTSLNIKQLLSNNDYTNIPKVGDVVKGIVVSVTKSEVLIDINGLTIGVIRGRELFDESNENAVLKPGDEIETTVIELENEKGEMELSLRSSGHQKAWASLQELMKNSKIVDTQITDANKGGLMIKIGQIAGFLPVSQLSPEHYPRIPGGDKNKILDRLRDYTGKTFEVKVIDISETENKLIVSEKAAWEEKQHDVISKYKIGNVVEGKVTAVTDFGVFVEFGEHLEGLIHISELAWQRIDNPRDIVKEGDTIKAEIIAMEGSKIFLSSKKLKTDPWDNINDKYKVGQVVFGKILKINPFGLFVELDRDIHGLAHISEISDKPVTDLSSIAKIGDVKEFKILSIEPKNHRLGLTLRSTKDVKGAIEKSEKKEKIETPKETPEPKPELKKEEKADVLDEKKETKEGDDESMKKTSSTKEKASAPKAKANKKAKK